MEIVRSTLKFIRETIAYILIGALITSVYANYKLIQRVRTTNTTSMPYVEQDNLDKDTMIRNATTKPSKEQLEGQIQLQEM